MSALDSKLFHLEKASRWIGKERRALGALEREDVMRKSYRNDYAWTEQIAGSRADRAMSEIRQACDNCSLHDICPIRAASPTRFDQFLYSKLQSRDARNSFNSHLKTAVKRGKDILCTDLMLKGRLPASVWRA